MLDLAQPWRGVSGLALALRFCRDGSTSLAQAVEKVPETHTRAVSRLADRAEGSVARCACGVAVAVFRDLVECAGRCGNWFISDESGVWMVHLPEQDPDE